MAFDYLGAKNAGYSDEEINSFLKQKTGREFDFAGAKKAGYGDNEINSFLAAYKQAQTVAPAQNSWRVDNAPVDTSAPKYNTTAVAAAPELFKDAPESVRKDAADSIVQNEINKRYKINDNDGFLQKTVKLGQKVLAQLGFGAADTIAGLPVPQFGSDPDRVQTAALVTQPYMSDESKNKLNILSKGSDDFSDEDLITAKAVYNPSQKKLFDEAKDLISGKHTAADYTQDDMQKYADSLKTALGNRYDIELRQDEKGNLVPFAKMAGADESEYKELKADGLGRELYTGFMSYMPITSAQIAGGVAMEKYAEPTAAIAASLPGVWGKIASGAVRAGAFGAGAYLATPVGVAATQAHNIARSDANWDADSFARQTDREQSDSLLFDAALLGGTVAYHAAKPIIPDIVTPLKKGIDWSIGRAVDGNSPSIEKTLKKLNVKQDDISSAVADRARFESVTDVPPVVDTSNGLGSYPILKQLGEMANAMKSDSLDARRYGALTFATKNDKLYGEVVKTIHEFPTEARQMGENITKLADSIMEEITPLLKNGGAEDDLALEARKQLLAYEEGVNHFFEKNKDAWQYLFPEKIDLKAASGLENEVDALRQSISAADQAGAGRLERIVSYLDNGDTVSDLLLLRRDINAQLGKKNSWNVGVALKKAKENIDASLRQMADTLGDSGKELIKNTEEANSFYAQMKNLQDNDAFYRKITDSKKLDPDSFAREINDWATNSDPESWKETLSLLAPATREKIENSVWANLVRENYHELPNRSRYIDYDRLGEELDKLNQRAFSSEVAIKSINALKEAAKEYRGYGTLQKAIADAKEGSVNAGLSTKLSGAFERWWVARWFKRMMSLLPYDVGRAMSFRVQLADAMKQGITPVKFLADVEKFRTLPTGQISALKKDILDDIIGSLPEMKQATINQIKSDIAAGMDKKLAVDKAMREYRVWEREANMAQLKKEADAANKGGAFNYMYKKDMSPEEIAATLKLEYKPQVWTVDAKGIVETGEWPKDKTKIQENLDRAYGESANPSQMKGEIDDGLQNEIWQRQKTAEEINGNGVSLSGMFRDSIPSAEITKEANNPSTKSLYDDIIKLASKPDDMEAYYAEKAPQFTPSDDKAYFTKNWLGQKIEQIRKTFFPTFQGGKSEMMKYVPQYIDKLFSKETKEGITTINEYFGGGGTWASAIAATGVMPNVKQINIYEYNYYRAQKIAALVADGKGMAATLRSERISSIIAAIYRYEVNKGLRGSGGAIASRIDDMFAELAAKGELDKQFTKMEQAALIYYGDYAKASFGVKDDITKNIEYVSKQIEGIGANFEKLRGRGVKIDVVAGFDSFGAKPEEGTHVLSIIDPPYYMTRGYDIMRADGTLEKAGIEDVETYLKTKNLIDRISKANNNIIYTDEAWEVEKVKGVDSSFKRTASNGESDYQIRDGIKAALDNYFILPYKIADRYEVLGFKYAKGAEDETKREILGRTGADSDKTINTGGVNEGRSENGGGDGYERVATETDKVVTAETRGDGVRAGDKYDGVYGEQRALKALDSSPYTATDLRAIGKEELAAKYEAKTLTAEEAREAKDALDSIDPTTKKKLRKEYLAGKAKPKEESTIAPAQEKIFDVLTQKAIKLQPKADVLSLILDFKEPIKTPLFESTISLDKLLNHLSEKPDFERRAEYINLIKPTLEEPLFITKEGDRYRFFKTFIDDADKTVKFLTVVENDKGEFIGITAMPVRNSDIKKLLKEDVVWGGDTLSAASTPQRLDKNGGSLDGIVPQEKNISQDMQIGEDALERIESLYLLQSPYKELGVTQPTLAKLYQSIKEGTELTEKQKELYAQIREYTDASGILEKYRGARAAAEDSGKAEYEGGIPTEEADELGAYIAKMREAEDLDALAAEAAQINKAVRWNKVRMDDADIEETLKGMGVLEKISRAEDMAYDEVAPEWAKAINSKAQKYYSNFKSKNQRELTRIHETALERMDTLQGRLYAYESQEKALADKEAIDKIQTEIAKLKAVEWASGGLIRASGGSGLLGGMGYGIETDENGNITGVDPEKFLIGLVGGAMAGAIIKGKIGQKGLEVAARKLEPLKALAVEEGNALAAKLYDTLQNSYFAKMVREGEEELIRSAGGGTVSPAFYSKLQEVAAEKLPNRFGATAAMAVLKKNGVKDEELKWTKIDEALRTLADEKGNIRKDDFMAWTRENGVKLEAKTLGWHLSEEEFAQKAKEIIDSTTLTSQQKLQALMDLQAGNLTKYGDYIVKNGENYREILTTAPDVKGKYKSSHWDEPNVLYHTRVQDNSIDGERTLLVEEIQSDWHQEGRKGKRVPDAPYAKTWHEKAMKDVIDDAVKNGYERVAWTTGDIQNARYDLAKFADEIIYNEKSQVLTAKKDGKEVLFRAGVRPEELESVIGKEPTKKLMANEPNSGGGRKISGEELSIGGDGMRGFYDKILPDFTKGYIKKWGATVEKKRLASGEEVWSFPVTEKMREEVMGKGQPLYAVGAGAVAAAGLETQNSDYGGSFLDSWGKRFGLKKEYR